MRGFYEAIISGILISLGVIFLKIGLVDGFSIVLLSNKFFLMSFVWATSGSILMQIALKKGKSGVVYPLINSINIILPSLLGIFFLNEGFSFLKLVSLLLILCGIILVG